MMSRLRLLPILIVVAGIALTARVGGLWSDISAVVVPFGAGQVLAQEAEDEFDEEEEEVLEEASVLPEEEDEEEEELSSGAGDAQFSRAELDLLQNLAARREELDLRARESGWGIARTEEEARAGAKSAVSSTVRTNIASAFLDLSKSEQTDDAGGLTGSDLEGVRSVLATSSLNVFTGFETVSVIQVDIEGDKWFVVTISAQPGAIVEDGAASATSPSVSLVRSHPVTGVVTQTDAGADGTIVTQAAGGDGGAANAAFN